MPVADVLRKQISETILFTKNYPYQDTDSFMENGVLDSMNVIELVLFLEQQFGIQVADHEIIPDNFDSIQQLTTFVQDKQQVAA
jgi:acyl carrier protein